MLVDMLLEGKRRCLDGIDPRPSPDLESEKNPLLDSGDGTYYLLSLEVPFLHPW